MNIKELLTKQAESFPGKAAFIFEDKATNYTQLKDGTFRLANYLLSLGLNSEDRVCLFLSNTPQAIFSFLGVYSAGLCIVPMDFMLTESEVINFINHSEAKILITQPKKNVDLKNIKKRCPSLTEIIICQESVEGFSFWDDIFKNASKEAPSINVNEQNLSSIFYTSGSTGNPKGVMLTYKNLDNPPQAIDHFLGLTDKDVFLCGGVPFSHVGGLDYILLMLYFSSTVVIMERFQPFEFLKNIEKYKVTIFCIVPAMYIAILSLKEYDKFDFSSLRFAVVFGAPSSPVLLKRFQKAYPNARLSNGWGMTETSAPNCMLEPSSDNIKSIGKFYPKMSAKIVDKAGNQQPKGVKGELLVKGEAVMKGYYKAKELTEEVITAEGWLKTGDISYCDEEGFFYIVGRKKDMIKVAGEIVFSSEVEEKIQRHPKVKEVAVIGVSDPLRGEVPKAFIVADEGQPLDEAELKSFLKESLAAFKIPHYFNFVDNLPRNRTGKIDKTQLS